MILRKTIIDNKEVFEPIELEEALKVEDKDSLVFTSKEAKEKFDSKRLELDNTKLKEDNEETKEKEQTKRKYGGFTFNFGEEFSKLGDSIKNIFVRKDGKNSKASKIISTLPFLDDEELAEIVDNIIANKVDYEDLSIVVIFPFLSKEKMDELFLRFVNENETTYISSSAPFVSKDALTRFVDSYIEGNHQDVNVDMLYPFMRKDDVKRIFNYIIDQKEEPEE